MTASIAQRPVAASAFGRFAGLRPLLRKDITEWMRGRRAAVVFALSTAFMVLTAANAWIVARITEGLPSDVEPPAPGSLVPLDNLLAAIGSQIFVFAAIFAVASVLVRERESGTLAWVASKPVSRGTPSALDPRPVMMFLKARSFTSITRRQVTECLSTLKKSSWWWMWLSTMAASWLLAAVTAWISPVRCKLSISIGTTWL